MLGLTVPEPALAARVIQPHGTVVSGSGIVSAPFWRQDNLLNRMQATTQGGLDVNSYRDGTSASLGITYAF